MTGIQIYNTCWLVVWVLGIFASLCCIIAGNWGHLLFLAASTYFSYLYFTDSEDGESLKRLLIRKIKAHRARKMGGR